MAGKLREIFLCSFRHFHADCDIHEEVHGTTIKQEETGYIMNLKFPPLSGGVNQGLNDAGIETFEGDYAHYVVRECTQNSLDAAASQVAPVRVEITLRVLGTQGLPFMPELRDALDRCEAYWRAHPRPRDFFRKARRYAGVDNLYLLKISDFGTTGVPGTDEDNTSPWFGLVRSRGVSIKAEEDSGGAFGIGKDAPLAASALRTVLYSSRTINDDVAFQGICRLATHLGESDLTQGTGFIGNYDAAARIFRAVRIPDEIPEPFRRNEAGLDVWVVGFRNITDDWEVPFVAAALRNFWPAIHFQRLTLRIGGYEINPVSCFRMLSAVRAAFRGCPFWRCPPRPISEFSRSRRLPTTALRLHS